MKKTLPKPGAFQNTKRINTLAAVFVLLISGCACLIMGVIFTPILLSSGIPGMEPPVSDLVGNAFTQTSQPPASGLPPAGTNTPAAVSHSTPALFPVSTPAQFAACVPANPPQVGRVVEVVDGDTIKVQIDGTVYPVRYIGMDTPEISFGKDPFGEEAAQKNSELVNGKDVVLIRDVSETDRYDRLLRYVFVGDLFVNYELVYQGFATIATYPPDVACVDLFREAQAYASTNRLGLWGVQVFPSPKAPVVDKSLQILDVNKRSEYVDIQNIGNAPLDLNGWVLLSEKGGQRCELGGVIQPGEILRIWSMDKKGGDYSCGFSYPIWNNSEDDPAVIYDPEGEEVDRYP